MKKNFFYNLLLTASNFLFPLLTFPYLTRVLGAEGLGICNFVLAYCQNFIAVAALGVPFYGSREIAKVGEDKIKRSNLFFELLSVHLMVTVGLLVIYYISIFTLDAFKDYQLIAIAGGFLIFSNVFALEWLFSGVSDFKYITIRSLIFKVLALVLIFILVKGPDDFSIYFIIYTGQILLTGITNLYHARNYITRKVRVTLKKIGSHLKPILLLGVYIVLTGIYTMVPTTLLGFFSTKDAVGYFYGAERIVRMGVSFFSAFSVVIIPRLNLVSEEKNEYEFQRIIDTSLHFVISFGLPIVAGVYLLAEPIVLILAGKGFVDSILCLKILAPIILCVAFSQIFCMQILNVFRKDKQLVYLAVLGMVVSVVLNLVFIPRFAQIATSFSLLIVELTVVIIGFFLARKAYKFDFPLKTLLANFVCVLPFVLITQLVFYLSEWNIIRLVASAAACGLYFLFYQFFILKDTILVRWMKPHFESLKGIV